MRKGGQTPTAVALFLAMLGGLAAVVSLLLNVVGSVVAGKENALELIRVYLTFPLGEKALALTGGAQSIGSIGDGMILAIGCCLYLFTGMLLGVPVANLHGFRRGSRYLPDRRDLNRYFPGHPAGSSASRAAAA